MHHVIPAATVGIPTHDTAGKPLSDKQVGDAPVSMPVSDLTRVPADKETSQTVASAGEETSRTP